MPNHLIVWDIETVPDLRGFAVANGHDGKSDHEIREAMGDKFPKHIYHSKSFASGRWLLAGTMLIGRWCSGCATRRRAFREGTDNGFVNRIAELSPQLVTFNGSGFDLPVLRYRAMVHAIPAVGLTARPYFHRYSDDAIDLCDVLSSYSSQAKVSLHELCKVMGLPGKPNGISGADVEKYYLGRTHPRDCRLLRIRCAQHIPGLAAIRTVPRWAIV